MKCRTDNTFTDELKTLAVELQDLVQSKVGTTAFANVYNQIRQKTLGIRRERKTARVIQAASNPAAASKRKQQRNSVKKDSRKRKNSTFAYVYPSVTLDTVPNVYASTGKAEVASSAKETCEELTVVSYSHTFMVPL